MYKIRDIRPSDKDFVFDSWLKSWRNQRTAGVIPNNMYFEVMRSTIENLISRGAVIKVACSLTDDDQIYGYICYEKLSKGELVVHYLYVKDCYLRFDVDEGLMGEITSQPFITFAYGQVKKAVERKFGHSRGWNPEIARRKQ